MTKIKIFLSLAVVAVVSFIYLSSGEKVRAMDLCSGAQLDLTLYNVTTGQTIGTYSDDGGSPGGGNPIDVSIPFGSVVRYSMDGSGTPSFTLGRYYQSGAYTHSEHTWSPNPTPGMSNVWTAPALSNNAVFTGQRYENICEDNPPYYGDQSAHIYLNISVSGSPGSQQATTELAIYDTPDVTFTINGSSTNATITQGQTATLAWTPTNTQSGTACTATSSPTNGNWNGSKSSTPGTTYTQSSGISTAGTYSIQCSGGAGSTTTVKTVTLTVNPNGPTASITCNGLDNSCSIAYNASATIAWTSTDATSCSVTSSPAGANWSGTSGSQSTGSLTQTTTYNLSCTGPGGGPATDSVTVNVGSPPPTADIKCNDADSCAIDYNTAAVITWSSANATACTVTSPTQPPTVNWSGTSGSQSTTPLTQTKTYNLSCTGPGGGPVTDSVVVTVNPDFTISCAPATRTINIGDTTSYTISTSPLGGFSSAVAVSVQSLTPGTANPPGISFSNNNQVPAAVTTALVTTNVNTTPGTYTIIFSGTGGGKTRTCSSVELQILNPGPTVNLWANGQRPATAIGFNGTANLTWTSTNASSCTASGSWSGNKALNNYPAPGENQTNLTNPTYTYTLTCTGPGGSAQDTVTVNVSPDPNFSLTCTPATQTITVGDTTSFSLTTTPINGFNSSVSFSSSISPSAANPPSISLSNNNQVPPAVTTAVVTTNINTTPNSPYTITFTGTGGGKTQQCSVALYINAAPVPSASITANGQTGSITVSSGSNVTIAWSSQNVTSCTITSSPAGFNGSGTSGSQAANNITVTTTYNQSCTGPWGSANSSVTVNIIPLEQDFSIVCAPPTQTITAGSGTSFTITTTPINGFNSSVNVSHTMFPNAGRSGPQLSYSNNDQIPAAVTTAIVSTDGDTITGTYSITFTATGGGKTHQCNTTLYVDPVPTPSVSITANGSATDITIVSGSSATIAWSSQNINDCTVTSSPAGPTWSGDAGSESTGALNTTTIYTANCTGPYGPASDSITVNINVVSNPDFGLTCTPATQNITLGDTAAFNLNTTAIDGFNSAVNFSVLSLDPSGGKNPPSISFVNNNQVPAATTTALVSTDGSTDEGTYTIVFRGTGGGKTHDCPGGVQLQISSGTPPSVTITANGSATDITISSGSSATIAWSSTDADSCTVTSSPAGFNGSGTSGSQSSGAVNAATIFTADCSGSGGNASDSVTVNVDSVPNPPATMSVNVAGCQQALVTWTAPSSGPSPTGYRVYRSTDGSSWGTHINNPDPLPNSPRTYTDAPPTGNYYYAVSSMNGAAESTKRTAGPFYVSPCTPDLSTSDKDIVSVSPVNISNVSQSCSGEHESAILNGNRSFRAGDQVTFRINVCNTGDLAVTGVVVNDTLTNLSNVTNVSYSGCTAGSHSLVAGGVNFNVGDVAAGGTCSISFTATVTKPATTSAFYRFQNRATITSSNFADKNVSTPLYQFTDSSGNPDRGEIAP